MNEHKILLISRYLIENSNEKRLELNYLNAVPVSLAKTKFKKLVGNVHHYTEREENELKNQLISVKFFSFFFLFQFIKVFFFNLDN